MKVSSLKGKVRELDIVVPGDKDAGEVDESVHVKFRPGALDLAALEEFEAGKQGLGVIRRLLEPLLVSWDLEDDILDGEGNPTGEVRVLGTTGADLGKVPLDFLSQLMEGITSEVRPNPLTPGTSEDGSPQEDASGNHLSGTESSKLPNTFA